MRIKSFRLFESIDIDLGEIEDIIQSEILDEFDGDIKILGFGRKRKYELPDNEKVVELDFPSWRSGVPFFGIGGKEYRNREDGFVYLMYDVSRISKNIPIEDFQFIYIMVDVLTHSLEESEDVNKLSKSLNRCFKRIKSMTGLDQYDVSEKKNEFNSIVAYDETFEIALSDIDVNWEDNTDGEIEIALGDRPETLSFIMILK